MTASWPLSLPAAPLRGSWSETLEDDVIAFRPEVGPPKLRRRATSSWSTAQAGFVMTAAQVSQFLDFYRNIVANGSLPFTFMHPVEGVAATWTFEAAPQINDGTYGAKRVTVALRRVG